MYLILKGLLLITLFFYVCYSPCIIQVVKMPWQKHLETGFLVVSHLFSLQTYRAAATDQQPLHRLIYIFVQNYGAKSRRHHHLLPQCPVS